MLKGRQIKESAVKMAPGSKVFAVEKNTKTTKRGVFRGGGVKGVRAYIDRPRYRGRLPRVKG